MSFEDLRIRTAAMRKAVEGGATVDVTWYNKPHTTCVPTNIWQRLVAFAKDGAAVPDEFLQEILALASNSTTMAQPDDAVEAA
jgi:hypothetical protein